MIPEGYRTLDLHQISKLPLGTPVIGIPGAQYHHTRAETEWFYAGLAPKRWMDEYNERCEKEAANYMIHSIMLVDNHPLVLPHIDLFKDLYKADHYNDDLAKIISQIIRRSPEYNPRTRNKGTCAYCVNHLYFAFLSPESNEQASSFLLDFDNY